ncbi:hypothetical protein [Pseudomonas borbori]|uniref:DUF2971 domain-containing protein n=1 Tax=Pseudomonas borbori TaxID=289003 RepID=A0A1I5WE11_9PSED|nr:hypothetical protein [Pseudomonas borbori]SFQ17847.1 hypothetical protein SAMN05216190_13837 [Pseudomonas borbori]
MSETWYHYTTAEGFYNIAKSKVLWASNAAHLNDPKDCHMDFPSIRSIIESEISDGTILREFGSVLQYMVSTPYIVSFTPSPDALVHWRAYSGDGTGISMGVCPKRLVALDSFEGEVIPPTINFANKSILLKVIYETGWLEEKVRYACKQLENRLGTSTNRNADYILAALFIKSLSYTYKSTHYKDEAENRLVHLGESVNKIYSVNYRLSRGMLTSYVEIPFGDNLEALKRVYIGPRCEIEERMLRAYLESEGFFNVDIVKSPILYR